MRKLILFAPLLLLSACGYSVFDAADDISQACSNGLKDGEKITTAAAKIGDFAELANVGPDKITFVTSNNFTIIASGDVDIIAKLRYKIKDGKLIVGREDPSWSSRESGVANITVSAPKLTAISAAGSGDIVAAKLETPDLKVTIAGSGNIDLQGVKVSTLKGSVAGSGNIKLAGSTDDSKFTIAGSGNIAAGQLTSKTAKASTAGSGDITLSASETVDANLVGSGNVTVTGGAKCNSKTVGSGALNCS